MEDIMNNFENTLIDVRKAYRLLHAFNSKIFDLMKFIESSFEMVFGGGRSVFTADTPASWKGRFENWIWDYFNLYFYEFYFESTSAWLSIILQSDTGLWDNIESITDEDEFNEKEHRIELFNPPENSKTRLLFITGNGEWNEKKIQKLYERNLNRNIENEIEIPVGKKGKLLCKIFDIDKFIDEETTLTTLNEYISFLSRKGFDKIKLIKKKT
jgi:hypothetical protein